MLTGHANRPTPVEIISPLMFSDIVEICHVSKNGFVALCEVCSEPIYAHVHMPWIARGFFCEQHCPCRTFTPTVAEVAALEANRQRRHWRKRAPAVTVPVPVNGAPGTIYITEPNHKFHGKRAKVWTLLRDGMTRPALIRACAQRYGMDECSVRTILVKMSSVYGCIKIAH